MLDECSTTTLCSSALMKKLRAKGERRELSLTTVNKTHSVSAMDIELTVHALYEPGNSVKLDHVLGVNHLPITADIPVSADLNEHNHLSDLVIPELHCKDISILIGSDVAEAFYETGPTRVAK